MSVIVKGLKMPEDKPIRIVLNPNGQLFVDHGVHFTEYEAVELPPHGRLIDADALAADLKRQCKEVFKTDTVSPDDFWITRNQAYNERLWTTWCESLFDYLKAAPAIIEGDNE